MNLSLIPEYVTANTLGETNIFKTNDELSQAHQVLSIDQSQIAYAQVNTNSFLTLQVEAAAGPTTSGKSNGM